MRGKEPEEMVDGEDVLTADRLNHFALSQEPRGIGYSLTYNILRCGQKRLL